MSIYTFSETELRYRFIKNIGNRDDIDVYIEVPVFCRSVDLVIQEIIRDDINGFSAYNDSIPYTVKTRNGILTKNRPTTDATLIAAIHFLNCKVFEWNYIENEDLSTVLDNLKSCYAQYQPKLAGHINKWCEIYGK